MLASHNDSTPISTNNGGPSSQAAAGSLTPMSTMHSGNWGNGSAYDANMGELMNLEELGSVLRWHEVNGTYPARTIKATLYDNEEGGLVGSGDYSAAGGGATLLQEPVSAGDTNLKVASVAPLNAAGTTVSSASVVRSPSTRATPKMPSCSRSARPLRLRRPSRRHPRPATRTSR